MVFKGLSTLLGGRKRLNRTHSITAPVATEKEAGFRRFLTTDLQRKTRDVILFQLTFPFLLSALGILIIYYYCTMFLNRHLFFVLGGFMVAYFFPPAGKESVIPLAISRGVPYYLIALAITFIDSMVSLFLIWNYDYAKKIPFFGHLLIMVEKRGRRVITRSRILSRFAYAALVLFVMVPFQGTGGAGATVIGRMIGMNPYRVFSAVVIGALLGTFLLALFSSSILRYFRLGALGVFAAIVVALIVYYAYTYFKERRDMEERR